MVSQTTIRTVEQGKLCAVITQTHCCWTPD